MTTPPSERVRSDAELIALVRERGSTSPSGGAAYDELVHRHRPQALRLATVLVGSMRAVELVEASATDVAATLDAGGGPEIAFRPYLLGVVRRAVEAPGAASPYEPAEAFATDAGSHALGDEAARAFAGLPERWQLALWHRAVESEGPTDLGELLGVPPEEIAPTVARAREALGAAFLAGLPEPTGACRATRDVLLSRNAGRRARRATRAVLAHVHGCAPCAQARGGLTAIDLDLREVLGAVVLGAAASEYLEGRAEPPATSRPPAQALTAALTAARSALQRRPALVAAAGVVLILLGGVIGVGALSPTAPERARAVGTVRIPLPLGPGSTLTPDPSAARTPATPSRAGERGTRPSTDPTPSVAPVADRPRRSLAPASPTTPSSTPRPAPTADVRVAASGSGGIVDWSVSGVPSGRTTTLVAEAGSGVALRSTSGSCSGSGGNRLTCTVGPGGSGRFTVFGLLIDTTVRVSVAAVAGYRDPATGDNATSVRP